MYTWIIYIYIYIYISIIITIITVTTIIAIIVITMTLMKFGHVVTYCVVRQVKLDKCMNAVIRGNWSTGFLDYILP